MFHYKIGYHGWEESDYVWLSHEREITQEQFEKMVLEITPEIAIKHRETRRIECQSEPDYEETSPLAEYLNEVHADAIYQEIANCLCAKFGFKRLETTAAISLWQRDDLLEVEEFQQDCFFKELQKACSKLTNSGDQ